MGPFVWDLGASLSRYNAQCVSVSSLVRVILIDTALVYLDELERCLVLRVVRVLSSSRSTSSFTLPTDIVVPVSRFLIDKQFSTTSAGTLTGVGSYFS